MAWQAGVGTHQFRKEASSHRRGTEKRAALAPRDRPTKQSKRPSNAARKFGVECRDKSGFLGRKAPGEWWSWRWYETEARRDQALSVFPAKYDFWEFRAVER